MSILVDLARIEYKAYSRTAKTRTTIYSFYKLGEKVYDLKNLTCLANLETETINFRLNDLAKILYFYFYTDLNKYLNY